MVSSFFLRIVRRLGTTATPITTFVVLSSLLTYIFILYQPTRGPGDLQQLGWQSWEIVSTPEAGPKQPSENDAHAQLPLNNSTGWWETEADNETAVDVSSLPLSYWDALLPHDTGLSEITVTRCMFPPWLIDACWPKSTPADISEKGKWVRVERDINNKAGGWYINLYYRRTRKLDVPLVTDLRLLPEGGDADLPDRSKWHSTGTSVRDGTRKQPALYLWWKLGPTLRQHKEREIRNFITELDVVYGAGPPMYGFETLDPPVTSEEEGKPGAVRIAFRRGPPNIPRARPLHFNWNGTYKILQVADLHFSVSHGKCRDTDLIPCNHADDLTSKLLASTLDAEKPDLVVFTGDQLNGQGTSWDSRSVLAKFAIPVIERKIAWAAVLGNHDDETDMSRSSEMRHMTQLPYFVGSAGPSTVHGVGNYVLKIYSADPSRTQLLTLYFLDSGSYAPGIFDIFSYSYDYLRSSQIQWFLNESAKIAPIQRPHVPDGAEDLGNLWKRQAALPANKRLAKPNAMMFFHIPLQESYNGPDFDQSTGKSLDVGQQLEGAGASKKNAGFFEKALMRTAETDDGRGREVKVVVNGHQHLSDNCRRVRGIWLCFAGGGSYAGYGKVGFDRRFRVFDISEYGETIQTYKRTEHGDILDKLILTGSGSAPYDG